MTLHRSITIFASASLALGAAIAAHAVTRADGGLGQVLIFPYYTTNGGNDTLLTVTNTSASAKALRVRFAEGENGRDVYSVDLYLAPADVWTAAITRPSAAAPAGVRTSDASCTVPDVAAANDLAGGGAAFSTAAFSGANTDPGGTSNDRTSEGWVEIIEMGTLADGTPSSIAAGGSSAGGGTRDCASLVAAWSAGGYWSANPKTDLVNPTGGIYGAAYVVNVEQGTIFGYAATALDDFRVDPADSPRGTTSSVVLHTAPGSAHPDLADALSDPATNVAEADVFAGGAIAAQYDAPANAIDAVSATLLASTVYDDFAADPTLGATTNLVFTYPTRRFYTDPAIAGAAAILPFTSLFAGIQHDANPEVIPFGSADRDGNSPLVNCGVDACSLNVQTPGTGVEIVDIGAHADAIFASALGVTFSESAPDARSPDGTARFYMDGAGLLSLPPIDGLAPLRYMRPDRGNRYFAGLPVLGLEVENLVNGNVSNGVLANYSSVVPQRWIATCYVPHSPDGACSAH